MGKEICNNSTINDIMQSSVLNIIRQVQHESRPVLFICSQ